MMKGTETGKDKIKRICEVLRKETLEPAKAEGEEIIKTALLEAENIISEARHKAEEMLILAAAEIEKKNNVFQSSLQQACKQALDELKQSIEEKLLQPELAKAITGATQDPKTIAKLIDAVVKALETDGIDGDLSVLVPAAVSADAINNLLAKMILDRLKEKSVLIGPFSGGIEVKLHKEKITIDLSDAALKELVAHYIRKDFRKLFFAG